MSQLIKFLSVLQFCVLIAAQRTALDSPGNLMLYGQVRRLLFRAFVDRTSNRRSSGDNILPNTQEEIPANVPFPCNVTGGRSPRVPTSVHRLRPGDIDVIGSIGDSLTAGNAIFATNLLEIAIENRGVSGSSGGQGNWRTYLTLPNILKEFNPKLFGYALGDSYTAHSASQFNVAEIGAMSRDMPFMAQYLVNKIKKDPRVDMKNHWKMITFMIGNNDFCTNICNIPSPWSIVDDHKKDLIKTLRYLRDNLPRTYVSLILPPHLKVLVDTTQGRGIFRCYVLTTVECPCLIGLKNLSKRPLYYEVIKSWQKMEADVAEYPEFHTEDFTVEVLPGIKQVTIPLAEDGYPDLSYMAYDCFHVSQKANALSRW
ncbi:phospholipase B1, membrane-associated isoform X2 [Nomia melanderi]|uniref:phospholipase B1, membrane-associated isoform X2 n=1 Tax=Nomia melanderi TaxID=2448451 RepID=UPI0013046730|nr:phospholipase B1, membrane-associated isoform X2 [Nomia melanderi]